MQHKIKNLKINQATKKHYNKAKWHTLHVQAEKSHRYSSQSPYKLILGGKGGAMVNTSENCLHV